MFSVNDRGNKNETMENVFKSCLNALDTMHSVEGPELEWDFYDGPPPPTVNFGRHIVEMDTVNAKIDESEFGDKTENVVIVGDEAPIVAGELGPQTSLVSMCATEKIYDFSGSEGIMNRWISVHKAKLKAEANPAAFRISVLEGVLKKISRSVNMLPIYAFVMGRYEMEFRLVIEAQPYQAGLVMMSWIPNPYGLIKKFQRVNGFTNDVTINGEDYAYVYGDNPLVYKSLDGVGYRENYCAAQRLNVKVDVNQGGDAILKVPFKYHKTFVRNYDYGFDNGCNCGIRGSFFGELAITVLSSLTAGAGQPSNASYQLFVRFVDTQMTAMTPATMNSALSNSPPHSIPSTIRRGKNGKLFEAKSPNRQVVQGAILSVISTVAAGASLLDHGAKFAEKLNLVRGRRITNRDKPVCNEVTVRSVPRPRQNFNHGAGMDDAIKMCLRPEDLTSFYEVFDHEPRSFKELMMIPSFVGSFKWSADQAAGASLMEWRFAPNSTPLCTNLDDCLVKHLVGVSSSMFTNYRGTVELMFQIVKTQSHHGSLEVQITFGRKVTDDGYNSTYTKICKIQDNSGFTVTIPYIHDVSSRFLGNCGAPVGYPNMYDPNRTYPISNTIVKVRVLNELVAPVLVEQNVNVLIWIKAGPDFSLNYPIPTSSIIKPEMGTVKERVPKEIRSSMTTTTKYSGYRYKQNDIVKSDAYHIAQGPIEEVNEIVKHQTQGPEIDFTSGTDYGNVISSMDHMNFKDILRIPVQLLNEYEYVARVEHVEKNDPKRFVKYGNCINLPVAPLSWSLLQHLSGASCYPDTIVRSSQYNINSMFAMFRGTLNYTMVFTGTTAPIYIAYIPHDQTIEAVTDCLCEPIYSTNVANSLFVSYFERNGQIPVNPANCGIPTVIVLPQVNCSEKIQIPMSNPNNWLLMNRDTDVLKGVGTLREQAEWFNGKIKIWSTADFKMDLFHSCGDDFELGGFLGHIGVQNWYKETSYGDDFRHQTEGFFNLERVCELNPNIGYIYQIFNSYWERCTLENLNLRKSDVFFMVMTQVASCYLGGGIVQPIAVMYITSRVVASLKPWTRLTAQVEEFVEGPIPEAIKRVEGCIEDYNERGSKVLMDYLMDLFPFVKRSEGLYTRFLSITKEVVHAIIAMDWKTTAFSFFCILGEIGLISLEKCSTMASSAMGFFRRMFTNQAQGPEEDYWSICGDFADLLISMIAVTFKVKYVGGLKWFFYDIIGMSSKFMGGLNATLNLIRRLIMATKKITEHFLRTKDPNIVALEQFSGKEKEIEEFISESLEFTNPMNKADFKKAGNRVKAIALVLRAHKLYGFLLRLGRTQVTLPLINLCKSVIKKGEEYQALFRNHLVKKEPFVILVEGGTEVGKSYSISELVPELLEDIHIQPRTPDYIYTVSPGVDYWNGWDDHLAVVYDDWCNLGDEETMRSHISQLYALKTSQPFNVPRAELENKEQIANPHLVFLCTNVAFPKHPMFRCDEAIYRRRDVRVKYVLKDPTKKISSLTKEQLQDGKHLSVYWYENAFDPEATFEEITWVEFKTRLREAHSRFHEREIENVRIKYERLSRIVRKGTLDNLSFRDPFQMIEDANVQIMGDRLTSELLENEINKLVVMIQQHMAINHDEVTSNSETTQGFGFFEIQEWMKEKVESVFTMFNNFMHRCEFCGELCQYKTGTLECVEGHYICVGCALHPPDNGETMFLRCPMHNEQCSWYFPPIFKVLIVNILAPITEATRWLTELKTVMFSKETFLRRSFFASLISLRYMLSKIFLQSAQGMEDYILEDENEVDAMYEAYDMRKHMRYISKGNSNEVVVRRFDDKSDAFLVVPTDDVKNFKSENSDYRYRCPHSLLVINNDAYYGESFYHVEHNSEHYQVSATCCSSPICELKNYEFVRALIRNFQVPQMHIKEFLKRNYGVIVNNFPPFVWPDEMIQDFQKYNIPEICKKDWWETYVSPIGAWFNRLIKKILPLMIVVSGIYVMVKLANYFIDCVMKWMGFTGFTQAAPASGQTNSNGEGRNKVRFRSSRGKQRTQSENLENKLNVIANNYILIQSGKTRFVALGVKGSTFLIPAHLVSLLRGYFTVEFVNGKHERTEFHRSNCDVKELIGRDLCLVDLKTKLFFKDITKFMKEKGSLYPSHGTMLRLDPKTDEMEDVEVTIFGTVARNEADSPHDGKIYVTLQAIRYDYQRPGMCGCVLVDDSTTPILGIHISGHPTLKEGCATPVYRCDIGNVRDIVEMEDSGDVVMDFGDSNLEYVGTVPKELAAHVPGKSKIVPSLISRYFEKDTQSMPAILSAEDERWEHERTPLYHGVQKHGRPSRDFHPDLVFRALTIISSIILKGKNKKHIRVPQVMNEKQAAVGLDIEVDDKYNIDESIYYDSIDDTTSSGWPYSSLSRDSSYGVSGTSKRDWLNYKRNESNMVVDCEFHPLLVDNLEKHKRLRQNGVLTLNVFQDCLKDERRPNSKVTSIGGTRVFSMSNVEATIALRKFTLDFTSFLRYNRLENWIGIGINPESYEWTILANRLHEISDNVFTTDFSNFGPGLNAFLVESFGSVVSMYHELHGTGLSVEEKVELDTLMKELSCSLHIACNTVYRTKSGSPSGAAITAELNSIVHLMLIVISWQYISAYIRQVHTGIGEDIITVECPELEILIRQIPDKERSRLSREMNLEMFFDCVFGVVYGDDGIFSVSEDMKDVFNAQTINFVLKHFGIGVTDATKASIITKYSRLEDAQFLKRKFRKHDLFPQTVWLPTMDWVTVIECCRWIHKGLDPKDATRENCESALRLSFGYGPHAYECLRVRLNKYLLMEGIREIHLSWVDVHRYCFPDMYISNNIVEGPSSMYEFPDAEDPEFESKMRRLYKKCMLVLHPDRGGDSEEFVSFKQQYDYWLRRRDMLTGKYIPSKFKQKTRWTETMNGYDISEELVSFLDEFEYNFRGNPNALNASICGVQVKHFFSFYLCDK